MRNRIACALILLALLAAGLLSGCAGGGGAALVLTVSGTVQDAALLTAIVGATASAQGQSVATGAGGFFALGNLTQNPVALSVAAAGHQTLATSVSVPGAALNVGTLYLAPNPVAGRGAVTGGAYLGANPAAGVTVFSGTSQALSDSAGQFRLYNLLPGVQVLTLVTADRIYMAQKSVSIVADSTVSAGNILLTSGPPPPPPPP